MADPTLIQVAAMLVRGELLPRSGRLAVRETHRLEEQHKRVGIAVRAKHDEMRAERDRLIESENRREAGIRAQLEPMLAEPEEGESLSTPMMVADVCYQFMEARGRIAGLEADVAVLGADLAVARAIDNERKGRAERAEAERDRLSAALRTLNLALANATDAIEAEEWATLGTVNETIQPFVDAAVAKVQRLRRLLEGSQRTVIEVAGVADERLTKLRTVEGELKRTNAVIRECEEAQRQYGVVNGDLAQGTHQIGEERDRLRRILAVEQGDESAAPEGWTRQGQGVGRWLHAASGDCVMGNPQEGYSLYKLAGVALVSEGHPTALETMEAADAALERVG